jgi:hypothetical protein
MKSMTIPIKVDERKLFRYYTYLLASFKPLSEVRKQERDVLAELMYSNYTIAKGFKNRENPDKWKLIFSYENKKQIEETLKISDSTLANCLTSLRKHGMIEDNQLRKAFRIYPDDEGFSLTFNLKLEDATGKGTEDN